jgi:hypothetical protein
VAIAMDNSLEEPPMKKLALFMVPVLMAAVFAAPQGATAAPPTRLSGATVPITFTDPATGDSFAGTLTVDRFVAQGGELAAVTTVAGEVTNADGTTPVSQRTTLDVLQINATCQILHLELGPLDLNLLGLMVHLDEVVLDITAQAGPGNLLGNLLCAIAGLLDSNAPLTQLVNQLVALLNNLLGGL